MRKWELGGVALRCGRGLLVSKIKETERESRATPSEFLYAHASGEGVLVIGRRLTQ